MRSDNIYPPFSVSMCVYNGDNAEWFDHALSSVIYQTLKPSEIVLVVDGPVSDVIQQVIDKYKRICSLENVFFNIIQLETNSGHGIARRTSVDNCRHDYVALMDADDISLRNRFKEEMDIILKDNVDVVGGDISEFIGSEDNIVGKRIVPTSSQQIKEYMKKRCPFNQMTVLFRKKAYKKAGGYLDWYCDEDYYLWIRMAQKDAVFENTGNELVHVRVGEEMYQRRGGVKYFISEAKLQIYMLNNKIISFPCFVMNMGKRFILQVLMPNKLRGWAFQKFARKS